MNVCVLEADVSIGASRFRENSVVLNEMKLVRCVWKTD